MKHRPFLNRKTGLQFNGIATKFYTCIVLAGELLYAYGIVTP